MPRWLLFLLFFAVALLVLGSVHYYLFRRLVLATALPAPWRTVGGVALALLAVSFPVSFFALRSVEPGIAWFVAFPVFIWLGLMMMLFFALLSVDLVQGVAWLVTRLAGRESLVDDPGRRVFLARVVAGAASTTVLAAAGYAVHNCLTRLVVRRVEVKLPGLPGAMDGFTIVQLTDIHLGAMRGGRWLQQVVRRTAALKPDLIAITGDLADVIPEQIPEDIKTLGQLQAEHGVFFVTGNHEYFFDLQGWLRQLRELGFRVLRNERVPIRRGEAVFDLAGVDDHEGARLAPGHGPDVARAMQGHDPGRASVLLAHQPRAAEEASQNGVGLVLSGHTHGGQIFPWNYLVYLQQPYVRGLHDHRGTQVYVSQGTGFWGPPMRLGSNSEITQVVLRSPA